MLTAFYRFTSSRGCLEIGLRTPPFPAQAPGLKESISAKAIEARHEGWKVRLPKSEADLWDALSAFDGKLRHPCLPIVRRLRLTPSMSQLTATMRAGSPHMVSALGSTRPMSWRAPSASTWSRPGWRPTVDNYLGRVTKPRILEAVRDAKGDVGAADRPSKEG